MRNQLGKQVFPKEGESKLKQVIQDLKADIKGLKKKIEKLENLNSELQKVLKEDLDIINNLTVNVSLEEVLAITKKIKEKDPKDILKDKTRKKYAEKYSVKTNTSE